LPSKLLFFLCASRFVEMATELRVEIQWATGLQSSESRLFDRLAFRGRHLYPYVVVSCGEIRHETDVKKAVHGRADFCKPLSFPFPLKENVLKIKVFDKRGFQGMMRGDSLIGEASKEIDLIDDFSSAEPCEVKLFRGEQHQGSLRLLSGGVYKSNLHGTDVSPVVRSSQGLVRSSSSASAYDSTRPMGSPGGDYSSGGVPYGANNHQLPAAAYYQEFAGGKGTSGVQNDLHDILISSPGGHNIEGSMGSADVDYSSACQSPIAEYNDGPAKATFEVQTESYDLGPALAEAAAADAAAAAAADLAASAAAAVAAAAAAPSSK